MAPATIDQSGHAGGHEAIAELMDAVKFDEVLTSGEASLAGPRPARSRRHELEEAASGESHDADGRGDDMRGVHDRGQGSACLPGVRRVDVSLETSVVVDHAQSVGVEMMIGAIEDTG